MKTGIYIGCFLAVYYDELAVKMKLLKPFVPLFLIQTLMNVSWKGHAPSMLNAPTHSVLIPAYAHLDSEAMVSRAASTLMNVLRHQIYVIQMQCVQIYRATIVVNVWVVMKGMVHTVKVSWPEWL